MRYNSEVESFRDAEYPMMKGNVYLDHGGTTIYAKSLIESFSEKMICNLYGNPHSNSDPSQLSSRVVETARRDALGFFGADPDHFDIIFTANATAAMKLVGESFRDLSFAGSRTGTFFYGYHMDAHTSLVGIRELTNGSHHCFTSDESVEKWLSGDYDLLHLPDIVGLPCLFAYPGQSNMTGRRLPLSWARRLRQSTKIHLQDTYSLLDAAALATTSQLDFSDPDAAPDFTAVSFYKIFGFPDLGGLIVRKKSGHILAWRRYFGGGTVNMLTVLHDISVQRKDETLHDALEDGTIPFHSIMALKCAIDVHKKLFGSMTAISQHTSFLSHRLYTGLNSLCHHNGNPLCIIYNDFYGAPYGNSKTQGATIAFNVLNASGTFVEHSAVEKLANEKGIYLRSGGLCNAGGIARHLQIEPWQFRRNWSSGFRCGGDETGADIINGKPTGVVRVSLGAMSTINDVDTFISFMESKFQSHAAQRVEVESIEGGKGVDGEKMSGRADMVEGCSIVRTDSGFHSRSTGSTAGSTSSPAKLDVRSNLQIARLAQEPGKQRLHLEDSQRPVTAGPKFGQGHIMEDSTQFKRKDQHWSWQTVIGKVEGPPVASSKGQTIFGYDPRYGAGYPTTDAGQVGRRPRFRFWKGKRSVINSTTVS